MNLKEALNRLNPVRPIADWVSPACWSPFSTVELMKRACAGNRTGTRMRALEKLAFKPDPAVSVFLKNIAEDAGEPVEIRDEADFAHLVVVDHLSKQERLSRTST